MMFISSFNKDHWPLIFAVLASLFISIKLSWLQIINPDGICYLMSAQALESMDVKSAAHLCAQAQWPFFSWLIFAFAQITHLSYVFSADFLDAIFSACSVGMFILIVRACGGKGRVLWFAAFTIIFAHEFNSVREYIVRDHGFWACYLSSLYLLIHFFKSKTLILAFMWSVSLILAALFRIEAAIFLFTLPFASFFIRAENFRTQLKLFCYLFMPLLLLLISCGAYLFHSGTDLRQLGRLPELINQLHHGLTLSYERYLNAKTQLTNFVLTKDSVKEANLIFFLMMLSWFLSSIIKNLSFSYSVLLIYAWLKRVTLSSNAALTAVFAYLTINIGITSLFLIQRFFLSKRYLIALSLVLMIWVPFAVDDILKKRIKQRLWLLVLLPLLFSSSVSGILDFGYSKQYIKEAGTWLATNVPMNAKLYANDYQLMYYSQHFPDDLFKNLPNFVRLESISDSKWQQFDYLALRLVKKDEIKNARIIQQLPMPPLKVYVNKRGDSVAIYKTKAN